MAPRGGAWLRRCLLLVTIAWCSARTHTAAFLEHHQRSLNSAVLPFYAPEYHTTAYGHSGPWLEDYWAKFFLARQRTYYRKHGGRIVVILLPWFSLQNHRHSLLNITRLLSAKLRTDVHYATVYVNAPSSPHIVVHSLTDTSPLPPLEIDPAHCRPCVGCRCDQVRGRLRAAPRRRLRLSLHPHQ